MFPKEVRVAANGLKWVFEFPNETEVEKSPRGMDGRLLVTLSQALNFQYKLVSPADGEWGRVGSDGNWTGMIGMLQRNEADLAIGIITITEERSDVVDFSVPYFSSDWTFVMNVPDLIPKEYVPLLTFDVTTWMSIFVFLFFMPLIFYSLSRKKYSYFTLLFHTYGNILGKSNKVFGGKLLTGFWWLCTTFISMSFAAIMPTLLFLPLTFPAVNTWQELANSIHNRGYKVFTFRGAAVLLEFRKKKGYFNSIANAIEDNDWFLHNSQWLSENQFKEKSGIIEFRPVLNLLYGMPDLSGKVISQDTISPVRIGIAVNKKFCCKHLIDSTLGKIVRSGLYQKFFEDELFKSSLTYKTANFGHTYSFVQMSLHQSFGAFIILLCGYSLSIAALMAEIIIYMLCHNC